MSISAHFYQYITITHVIKFYHSYHMFLYTSKYKFWLYRKNKKIKMFVLFGFLEVREKKSNVKIYNFSL